MRSPSEVWNVCSVDSFLIKPWLYRISKEENVLLVSPSRKPLHNGWSYFHFILYLKIQYIYRILKHILMEMCEKVNKGLKDSYCVLNFGHYTDKGRLQTLKRKFKLIPSGCQPKLFNLAGRKLFQRFCFLYFKLVCKFLSQAISDIYYFHLFSLHFLVGIWYQVHPGQYSHNIVFDKSNSCIKASKKVKISKAKHSGPTFVSNDNE